MTRVAIVTGGGRGLGRNTVEHLAMRGVDTILTYRADRAEADKVVAAVEVVADAGLRCRSRWRTRAASPRSRARSAMC